MSTYQLIAREMARYSRWQNRNLIAACDGLDEAQLHENQGAFFGSVFATLNHIVYVDQALLKYIRDGQPPEHFDANHQPCADYAQWRDLRTALDEEIVTLMDEATSEWFDVEFEYFSDDLGTPRRRPRALFISQMFNHQTHHRSQATAVLHQLGVDYGNTDMPFNPDSLS